MTDLAELAELTVPYSFQYSETKHYMRSFLCSEAEEYTGRAVSVTDQEFSDWEAAGNKIDGFAEFCLLCQQTSEYLLMFDRCIIHGAALSFAGCAWLIAAGSGVGKSTLCRSLKDAEPESISIINGDKPALRYDTGEIIVHPSPWNGKEGWHGAAAAPLAGVFLLQRGEKTSIENASRSDAAVKLYRNIFQSYRNDSVIKSTGKMAENIIKAVPVWSLTSFEVPETTELVFRTMQEVTRNGL